MRNLTSLFQDAAQIHGLTQKFLESNQQCALEIDEYLRAFGILFDLISVDATTFYSGHLFPFLEADTEISNSLLVASIGCYRLGFTSHRSVLELGLLSIFYDSSSDGERSRDDWLKAKTNTPFFKDMCTKLFKHPNFEDIQSKYDLKNDLATLYYRLCDFTHTKGGKHSNRRLGGNLLHGIFFNEGTFLDFISALKATVKMSVILHLVRYPVGLLHTPLYAKFGLNRPVGTFLSPEDSEHLKKIVGVPYNAILQSFADADSRAQGQANYVSALPDLPPKNVTDQFVELFKEGVVPITVEI
jgi:hypothetical protein